MTLADTWTIRRPQSPARHEASQDWHVQLLRAQASAVAIKWRTIAICMYLQLPSTPAVQKSSAGECNASKLQQLPLQVLQLACIANLGSTCRVVHRCLSSPKVCIGPLPCQQLCVAPILYNFAILHDYHLRESKADCKCRSTAQDCPKNGACACTVASEPTVTPHCLGPSRSI